MAVIAYVLARRPREPSSWALAVTVGGLLLYYLGEFFLYRDGLPVEAGFFWQKTETLASGVTSLGAVGLALALRETPLPKWERLLTLALVAHAVFDMAYIALISPQPVPGCALPSGLPMLHCGRMKDIGSWVGLATLPLIILLYFRTFRLASDERRRVLTRHLLPAVLLICLAAAVNIGWGIRAQGPLFPTALVSVPAAALVASGLLRMEQSERGDALVGPARGLIIWSAALVVAVALDAWWLRNPAPLLALLTLVAGLAAGLAALARGGASVAAPDVPLPAAPDPPTPQVQPQQEPAPRLRIHLFGPFLVERDGEPLPNHAKFWRSDKSRSLLAYLALAGEKGLTRGQLVDALWPLPHDGDGEAEQKSINSLYSYLSTLRKVLEPHRPPVAESVIAHDGDRYRLVGRADVWVDTWEFARWNAEAERLIAACDERAAVDAFERVIALHGEEGLLPDDAHLPLEVIEPERERLRQGWLRGVRWLARYYAQRGPVERAVTLWEMAWRAAPLHAEAYDWLVAHYRRTGQSAQLAALEEARRRAAQDIGEEDAA